MNQTVIIGLIVCLILLCIITYFVKKPRNNFQFDIDSFIKALGGLDNIETIESRVSKVKVKVISKDFFDAKKMTELGASGIVENGHSIILIFGEKSNEIVDNVNKLKG